jgi:hypothetical protein
MPIIEIFNDVLMITAFVMMMMLVVEYINVQTRGRWQRLLVGSQWSQYLVAAVFGMLPGCLGSFAMVTLYTHRLVSLGAIVTTMIATSGDEAFVMLALFPGRAVILTLLLGGIGVIGGFLVDQIFKKYVFNIEQSHLLPLHEEICNCFQPKEIFPQLRHSSLPRIVMIGAILLFLTVFIGGWFGPEEWNWVRVTLILVALGSLWIVATVPEHFLREHLWQHVVLKHVPAIFLWTLGTLLVINLFLTNLKIEQWLQHSQLVVLLIAALVGLIPESGPHLLFVNMYAQHLIPFSVLITNSIVQDGHGVLPLLAQSRRDFVLVKVLNLIVGLAVGIVILWLGW